MRRNDSLLAGSPLTRGSTRAKGATGTIDDSRAVNDDLVIAQGAFALRTHGIGTQRATTAGCGPGFNGA